MKLYIAHNFNARLQLRPLVETINQLGHKVTASWITDDSHLLSHNARTSAYIDLEDIDRAEGLILFLDQFETNRPGKGKFFEFGYAVAKEKEIYLIGTDTSCIFTNLFESTIFATTEMFLLHLESFNLQP